MATDKPILPATSALTEDQLVDRELKALQLIETKERIAATMLQREQRRMTRDATEASLIASDRDRLNLQARCTHRKGGRNIEQFNNGDSSHYAINKHTLPDGEVMVICLRCQKPWRRPIRAEYLTHELYTLAVQIYQTALTLPTDNDASGGQIVQMVSAA